MLKLNENKVRIIRRLRGRLGQVHVARLMRVSQPTVSQVQLRRTWKEVSR